MQKYILTLMISLMATPAAAQAAGGAGVMKITFILLGLCLFIASIIGAFYAHYVLDIKRTNDSGVIEVKNFGDFIRLKFVNFIVTIGLVISSLAGIILMIYGFAS